MLCDFSPQDTSSHETCSLYPDPYHIPNHSPNTSRPDLNPNHNSVVAVTACLTSGVTTGPAAQTPLAGGGNIGLKYGTFFANLTQVLAKICVCARNWYFFFRFSPKFWNFCQNSMTKQLFYAICVFSSEGAANLPAGGRQNQTFRHCLSQDKIKRAWDELFCQLLHSFQNFLHNQHGTGFVCSFKDQSEGLFEIHLHTTI